MPRQFQVLRVNRGVTSGSFRRRILRKCHYLPPSAPIWGRIRLRRPRPAKPRLPGGPQRATGSAPEAPRCAVPGRVGQRDDASEECHQRR